nr:MAG TPA: hypothetical protein [Siphoviridae sp. ctEy724]
MFRSIKKSGYEKFYQKNRMVNSILVLINHLLYMRLYIRTQ